MGTGGDFTVNGTLEGARGPSEFWANSAEFDGSTGSLSSLVANSQANQLSYILKFKLDNTNNHQYLFSSIESGTDVSAYLYYNYGSATLNVMINEVLNTKNWNVAIPYSSTDWSTLIVSANADTGNYNVYLNGVNYSMAKPSGVNFRNYDKFAIGTYAVSSP